METTKPKRRYIGYKLVQNTVLDYLDKDGNTTHTAVEIARECNLSPSSVRMAAKRMGVAVKPAARGGVRTPCNQHTKPQPTAHNV